MTQEDKELLLKDLCSRLPYGVEVAFRVGNNVPDIRVFTGKDYDYLRFYHYIDDFTNCTFKPYLRPMSSMTKEEKEEYDNIVYGITNIGSKYEYYDLVDWLNKKMFDYRGFIEKGLALEAPEVMYKHFGDMDVVVTSVEHKYKL